MEWAILKEVTVSVPKFGCALVNVSQIFSVNDSSTDGTTSCPPLLLLLLKYH